MLIFNVCNNALVMLICCSSQTNFMAFKLTVAYFYFLCSSLCMFYGLCYLSQLNENTKNNNTK